MAARPFSRQRRAWLLAAAGLLPAARAPRADDATSGSAPLASRAQPMALSALWQEQRVGSIPGNQFTVESDGGASVLRIDSHRSASSLVHRFERSQPLARLSWRWRTDAWPTGVGAHGEKPGDDFSLRLYVMFDYPLPRVPLADRVLLRLARALYDPRLPAATLCYVADPRVPAGTVGPSPYTSRVQVMVLRSDARPGAWWSEERDLRDDFQRAFGTEHGPGLPPVAALALAADTDQGGGQVRSWFSDPRWTISR